jgi:DNA polymerase III epsilon subunit family exonuclease
MLSDNYQGIEFAFLDIETTGLDPFMGDKMCEIAILKTREYKVLDRLETLVNPGISIPPRASSINRITDDMVRKAPFFRNIAFKVKNFLADSILIAHNARFDLGFLYVEFNNLKLSPPGNAVLDTLRIARRYYDFPSNNLGDIARSIGISTLSEHRAFADVRITKEVFEFFIIDLKRRGMRIKSLKDILKLQGKLLKFDQPSGLVLPQAIEGALRTRGKLQITYLSAYSDVTTTRIIEPIELNLHKSNTYLLAYCHLRKERCSFRLDRILEVKSIF